MSKTPCLESRGIGLKGLPNDALNTPLSKIGELGLSLLDDELMLPAAVLRQDILDVNRAWMRGFLEAQNVQIAPHGKTTMSPELFNMQIEDGAWGMTAATAHHVRIYAEIGVKRIIMANQLIGSANISAVLDTLEAYPNLEFFCLVDDVRGVQLLSAAVTERALAKPVNVLLELGAPGERAGVRSLDDAMEVAKSCQGHRSAVSLRGVETFEGVFAPVSEPVAPVTRLLDLMIDAAKSIDQANLFEDGEIYLTAGGSAFFDLATDAIANAGLSRPAKLIIRSGCYLTHDSKLYNESFEKILERRPELKALGRFKPALEVWAHVQSRPEPGRAIAALGKRDISNDVHRPQPVWIYRQGRDDVPNKCPETVEVVALYDQHACLDVPADLDLQVGDFMGFGVSHPCTTFDKWKALYLVDENYRTIDLVRTYF